MTSGDIVCPGGYDLQNDKCVQLNPSQNHVWDFVYQIEINCSLSCELCKNNSIVSYNSTVLNITNQMAILVEEVKKNVSIISVEMSCTCGDVLMSNVTVKVDPPSGRHNIASNITSSLGREGTTIILNHLLNYLYAANSTVLFSRVTFYAFHSNHVSFELKYICPGYFVSDKDSAIEKTDLMLRGSEDNYHEDRYIRHNGSTFICYESHGPGLDDPISLALAALTIFLNILSFACICVRIVLQFTTKRYSSAANRMQFQLCLALGMSTGLLILTPLASPNAQVCFYFLLPLNISVIWHHLLGWLVLRETHSACCIQDDTKRSLIQYHLISLLIPLSLTGVVVCLDYLPIPNNYKPQFGSRACRIMTMKGKLVYFVFPVSFFVAMNMIFFLLTTMTLRKTFQSTNNVHQSTDKNKKYQVHFKLFILMGLMWIIGIIAPWANTPAVWLLFVILNSSQGVFIFFAFVFKSKYLYVLHGKCCHRLTCDATTVAEAGQRNIIEIQQLPSCTQIHTQQIWYYCNFYEKPVRIFHLCSGFW